MTRICITVGWIKKIHVWNSKDWEKVYIIFIILMFSILLFFTILIEEMTLKDSYLVGWVFSMAWNIISYTTLLSHSDKPLSRTDLPLSCPSMLRGHTIDMSRLLFFMNVCNVTINSTKTLKKHWKNLFWKKKKGNDNLINIYYGYCL